MNLLEIIERTSVAGDGDLALVLRQHANDNGLASATETLCLTDPGLVRAAHTAFADAGISVLRTNTLSANALFLKHVGFEGRVNELNWTAAQIACDDARGRDILIAGRVGPLPGDDVLTTNKMLEIFLEQLGALLDGGARALVFEGFTPGPQLQAALEAKQTLHHCPAIGICTPEQNANEFHDMFLEWGGDVIAMELAAAADAPEAFAARAESTLRDGASLIFGGRGAGPAHLQRLCARLRTSANG
jgi:methionine synthase I (cobalamin-dependent)